MERESCLGRAGRVKQYDEPVWEPLAEAVGERLAGGFMWMHEYELEGGLAVHAYKHIFTRRYLYLAAAGRAFEYTPCERLVPLRLDFAIEAAVCTWWILSGWEPEDVEALRAAVMRSQELAHDRS